MTSADLEPDLLEFCECLVAPPDHLTIVKELGLDRYFAEVSVWVCRDCGRRWLRYFYEVEAFTGSGRWYLGAITSEQSAVLIAEHAKETLEALDWYYYGGSYYDGRKGRASGKFVLNP
jgi:hypothetical protein